jgi:hypothetical protein
MLPISRHWVRFGSFFGHRFSEQKTKHEDTKEYADTKTRRIPISVRGARKSVSSLCLGALVVGLMIMPDASTGSVLHEVDSGIRLNSSAMNKSGKNPNAR